MTGILRETSTNLHLANKGDAAAKLLVNHKAKDAHHGSTAIVELDGTLLELGLLIEGVPAEVKGTVTEVTRELSLTSHIFHDEKLKEANEGNHLEEAARGHGLDGGPAVGDGIEGGTGVINVTGKTDTSTVDDVAKEGKLADTAVLELDVTEAVEALLVGISKHAKGVEETKRGLGTELTLEGIEGGGSLADLGRGEGDGGAGEEGSDSKLHGG